jgi:hypothetical protein
LKKARVFPGLFEPESSIGYTLSKSANGSVPILYVTIVLKSNGKRARKGAYSFGSWQVQKNTLATSARTGENNDEMPQHA